MAIAAACRPPSLDWIDVSGGTGGSSNNGGQLAGPGWPRRSGRARLGTACMQSLRVRYATTCTLRPVYERRACVCSIWGGVSHRAERGA